MTLLYIALSVFPIIDVPSPAEYALKTGAVIVIANICGVLLYRVGRQKN